MEVKQMTLLGQPADESLLKHGRKREQYLIGYCPENFEEDEEDETGIGSCGHPPSDDCGNLDDICVACPLNPDSGEEEQTEDNGSRDVENQETENERWILHCAVNDQNWKDHLAKLTFEEVEFCLDRETRKTAISNLNRRKTQLSSRQTQ